MVLLMLVIILTAIFGNYASNTGEVSPTSEPGSGWFAAFGVSLIAVFFSYGGYQQTMNFGADIENPQRNLPRAVLIGVGIILGLYLLINGAYYLALGFEQLKGADLVAADTMEVFWGAKGQEFVSVTIFLSVLCFLNATLMSTPRM